MALMVGVFSSYLGVSGELRMNRKERDGRTPRGLEIRRLDVDLLLGQLMAFDVKDGDMVVLRIVNETSNDGLFREAAEVMSRVKEILGYQRLVVIVLPPHMELELIPREEAIEILRIIEGRADVGENSSGDTVRD